MPSNVISSLFKSRSTTHKNYQRLVIKTYEGESPYIMDYQTRRIVDHIAAARLYLHTGPGAEAKLCKLCELMNLRWAWRVYCITRSEIEDVMTRFIPCLIAYIPRQSTRSNSHYYGPGFGQSNFQLIFHNLHQITDLFIKISVPLVS